MTPKAPAGAVPHATAGWSAPGSNPVSTICRTICAAARAIVTEGHNALAFIKDFVAEEKLACDFDVGGKFFGAHTPAHFEKIAAAVDRQPEGLAVKAHVVPRAEQAREIDTDLYHGGVVFEEHASIDPAKYHSGLLAKVRAAGVTIVPHCRASAIRRDGDRFTVESEGGTVDAGQVLVATNGYTDALAPWVRRRVIPIGSYMIATEPLPAAVMDLIRRPAGPSATPARWSIIIAPRPTVRALFSAAG